MKFSLSILFLLLFVPNCIAQKVSTDFLKDTFELTNMFQNIHQLDFPKRINHTTLTKLYASTFVSHKKSEEFDKKMFDISVKLGDIYFSYFIYKYIDVICMDCNQNKKNFFHWYIMNYYYIPTAMLYSDTTLCPCLVKKIQFPDSNTLIFDIAKKLYCIPLKSIDNFHYHLYDYNPFFDKVEKYVYNWEQIIPNDNILKKHLVKKSFEFVYNDSTYSTLVTFNTIRFSLDLPLLGKDPSIINQKLDYNMDTSLMYFLAHNLKKIPSEVEQINFLLSFVQQGIDYQTDANLLSVEDKTLLPEETLYRGQGDCEDKALLFAYLVKRFIKKSNIILVIYENHANIGINIKQQDKLKTFIKYKGKKYFICETTGNLPLGSDLIKVQKELQIIKL